MIRIIYDTKAIDKIAQAEICLGYWFLPSHF